MIHLVYSNRTEELLGALVAHLRTTAAERHPLEPVEVVVPNRNMEAYLRFGVAEALGIAANLRFRRLERWVEEVVAETSPGVELIDKDLLQGALLAVLLDEAALADGELAPVASYLGQAVDPAARELRLARLAGHLGRLFEEYLFSRPEMLAAWDRGERWLGDADHEGWQAALWRRARALLAGRGAITLDEWLEGRDPATLPSRPVHVFGVSYVARVFQSFLAAAAAAAPLHVYTLNPCREYWEDVETIYEHRRRLRQAAPAGEVEDDPFGLLSSPGPLPLRLWGRPGRENIRLLNELSDCDFVDRFAPPPAADTLLGRLQADILDLAEPAGPGVARADGSLEIVAAPSPRREAEAVAEDIWRRLREEPPPGAEPLRFHEIAVIVNPSAQAAYLPHLTAAFSEIWEIPHSVSDLPLAAASRAVEGARLLLELSREPVTRASLLRVMTHPAVLGSTPEVTPERWARLAETLGIRLGADAGDLAGTYLADDRVSWNQGLRRLALATFLPAAEGDDEPTWATPEGREELVPRLPADGAATDGRFALLARHLLADLRAIPSQRRTLGAWAQAFRELWRAVLDPEEGDDLLPVLGAVRSLERADVAGLEVPGRVAVELALAALGGLAGTRGRYLAEGVVVSSFLPMRAIPFRVVYVLGLGEGLFPAATRRDELDLRSSHRRAGDVEPSERDKYMFLETLLSARERLVLSYPSRDETSGEERQPSGVVLQLLRVLREGYLDEEEMQRVVTRRPALRREEALAREAAGSDGRLRVETLLPGAVAEAAALRQGEPVRAAWRGEPPSRLLHRLRQHLAPDARRALGAALGLPDLEEPPPLGDRSLTIRNLRHFLECPLQASAKVLLRLREDDEETPEEVEDEELATSRPERAMLLRAALERALRRGIHPREAYRHLAERRALAGRGPLGVLADRERESDGEVLDLWWDELARRGIADGVEIVRVGPAPEADRSDRSAPAIGLEVAAGESAVTVELGGATGLLVAGGALALVPDPGGDGDRVRLLRYALRAWGDHLLLAAAGVGGDRPRRALVLRKNGVSEVRLQPCSPAEARRRLAALTAELLAAPHPYLLPCEAVLGAWSVEGGFDGDFSARLNEKLTAAVDDPSKAGSSRFGAVTDLTPYPPPPRAAELARRRFAPVLELIEVAR